MSDRSAFSVWKVLLVAVRPRLIEVCAWSALSTVGAVGSALVSMQLLANLTSLSASLFTCLAFATFTGLVIFAEYQAIESRVELKIEVGQVLVQQLTSALSSRTIGSRNDDISKSIFYSDILQITEFFRASSIIIVPSTISLVLMTPALYFLVGVPGLVGVVLSFLQLSITLLLSRLMKPLREKSRQREDTLLTSVEIWVRNIRLLRWLGWGEIFEKRIDVSVKSYLRAATREHFLKCFSFGITHCWWMIAVGAVLGVAQYLKTDITTGSVFGAIWLMTLLFKNFSSIPYALMTWTSARVAVGRIEGAQKAAAKSAVERRPWSGRPIVALHLNNVTVERDGRRILDNITTSIDLRKCTAIVGEVGAGKSVLLQVLVGLITPDRGEVLAEDDRGKRQPASEVLTSISAFLPQEPFLTNGTIGFNIALDEEFDDTLLQRSVAFAELGEDVDSLGGMTHTVGDSGIGLSGGQKQRLGLARVYYSQRQIWLLDSPLSALDRRTRDAIKERLSGRRGLIIALHHADELPSLDRVIAIEKGRLQPALKVA